MNGSNPLPKTADEINAAVNDLTAEAEDLITDPYNWFEEQARRDNLA